MHVGLHRCDCAKRLSRKRVIALLDEEWRSTNLRGLELWNPVGRPHIFASTLRVFGVRCPHSIRIAGHAASASETRSDGHAVRRQVGGSDQSRNPKPLPFHMQRFNRTFRIIPENQEQISGQVPDDVDGIREVKLSYQRQWTPTGRARPWEIYRAIGQAAYLGRESILRLTFGHDENIDWDWSPPIVLIDHAAAQPLDIANVAGARDVAAGVVAVPLLKRKAGEPITEVKFVVHDEIPVTRTKRNLSIR
jgi:hypothetical protein